MCDLCFSFGGGITRRGLLGGGAAAGLAPLLGAGPARGRAASVTEICDNFVDRVAEANPILSGRVFGVGRGGTAVTDWSVEGAERTAALLRETVAELDATPPVDRREEIAAGFLRDSCVAVLKGHDAGEHLRRMSTSIFTGPPAMLLSSSDLMERHIHGEIPVDRATRERDWGRVGERMAAVLAAMAGYVQSLQAGLAAGLPASRRMTLAVADQCRGWAQAGWFASYVAAYGEGPLRPALDRAAAAADRAYGETAQWLRQTYAPRAVEADGIGAGRFAIQAEIWLGLKDLDLDAAYDWASAEYARLVSMQQAEAARIRPGASVDDVRVLLDADPAHVIEGAGAFRDWAQTLVDEAIAELGRSDFAIPDPLRTCEVRMTESGAGAMPFYLGPPEDFCAPGAVVWPTLGQARLPTWSAVTTVLHESVPGHHLQLGGTRLLNLTRVQRVGASAGHAEGWALYAERLMDERGWYDMLAKQLSFLYMEGFRSARVVVDIGLHTRWVIPTGFPGAGERWSVPRAPRAFRPPPRRWRSSAISVGPRKPPATSSASAHGSRPATRPPRAPAPPSTTGAGTPRCSPLARSASRGWPMNCAGSDNAGTRRTCHKRQMEKDGDQRDTWCGAPSPCWMRAANCDHRVEALGPQRDDPGDEKRAVPA